jgi:hypothetical protein
MEVADWKQLGQTILVEEQGASIQVKLSSMGDVVAVGSFGRSETSQTEEEGGGGNTTGHVRVFQLTPLQYSKDHNIMEGSSWVQIGNTIIDGGKSSSEGSSMFGYALAMDDTGTRLVVGGPHRISKDTTNDGGETGFGVVGIYDYTNEASIESDDEEVPGLFRRLGLSLWNLVTGAPRTVMSLFRTVWGFLDGGSNNVNTKDINSNTTTILTR